MQKNINKKCTRQKNVLVNFNIFNMKVYSNKQYYVPNGFHVQNLKTLKIFVIFITIAQYKIVPVNDLFKVRAQKPRFMRVV